MLYRHYDIDSSFQYRVIKKKNIKHLYIRIKDGEALITANKNISQSHISEFVQSKSSWIQQHLKNSKTKEHLTDKDALIYLLGKRYTIKVIHDLTTKEEFMEIDSSTANFVLRSMPTHNKLQTLRDNYYKKFCHATISPLVSQYSKEMNLQAKKITYRNNKTRWGSCSSQNNISLNSRLMILPKSIIIYVVIHELAHIKHKNHSLRFWRLVEHYCPNYKELRRGIRAFESLL
ncbi:MAG: M48 family metallopeptidase [Sulfurovum sp.]|nr:M48 family metallopeptidase [Sulfurovum sp.]